MSNIKFASVLSIWLAAAPMLQADLVLGLAFDDSTTSKSVVSGSTVFVDMFLSEDAVGGFTTGLASGGGQLTQTAGTATVASAGAPTLGVNAAPNWGPGPLSQPVVGGIDSALVSALLPVGMGSPTVQIARFALIVTGAVGETATITSGVLGSGLSGNTSGSITPDDLDILLTSGGASSFGTVNLSIISSVAAIPEPSSYLAGSLLAGGWFWWRRRNRKVVAGV